MSKDDWSRDEALKRIAALPAAIREDIARIIETAETQGDWFFNGEDSVYEDSVAETLNGLAAEFRPFVEPPPPPQHGKMFTIMRDDLLR